MKDDKLSERLSRFEKQSLPIMTEQHKLVLSLATGTLVISLTFIEKIAPSPNHKWMIVTGWIFLLICILAAVKTIVALGRLLVTILTLSELGENREALEILVDKSALDRMLVKGVLTDDIIKAACEKSGIVYEIDKLNDYRNVILANKQCVDDLKKVLSSPGDGTEEMWKRLFKLGSIFNRLLFFVHPKRLLTTFGRLLMEVTVLPYVTLWSFYAGLFMITLFAILNYLK